MLINNVKPEKITIQNILNNPLIYQLVNGTSQLQPIIGTYAEELTYKGFQFLPIHNKDELIGVFSYREVTDILIEAHIHILPEYHNKGLGKEAVEFGCKEFKAMGYNTIITFVPSNCSHVLKFMKDNNFEACGSIPEAIIYKNELVSSYIFKRGL